MAALTETTANMIDIGAGTILAQVLEIDPGAATVGTVTVSELTTVLAVFTTINSVAQVAGAATAQNPVWAADVDNTTTNEIDLQALDGNGENLQAGETVNDFFLLAIGN